MPGIQTCKHCEKDFLVGYTDSYIICSKCVERKTN